MRFPTDEPRSSRGLLLVMVPAAAMLAVVAILWTRRGAEIDVLPPRSSPPPVVAARAELPRLATAAPRPKPAPDSVIAEKTMEARVRTTYMNYRTAVATGNDPLRKILEPVLLKDRDLALQFAQEELALAKEPLDQSIARKIVEALRN